MTATRARIRLITLLCLECVLGAAQADQCFYHSTRSECLVFRTQHGCVWHVPGKACVPDLGCDEREQDECHTELTTGISAPWDTSTNKCFWDEVRHRCRWSDECITQRTEQACITASCAWETLCTPDDMRSLPGPGRCSEVCMTMSGNASHTEEQVLKDAGSDRAPIQGIHRPAHTTKLDGRSSRSGFADTLTDVVSTSTGDVQGVNSGKVQKFLGIPFAQAPVAELRWAPPEPLTRWTGVFQATSYGPSCTQAQGYFFKDPSLCQGYTRGKCLGYTEDCLNLNIWTPSLSGSRAVMVWIHGGCFVSGSASSSTYDGSAMAATHDVVMVTIQYRLAAFGFLGDDLLRPRDPSGSTGNYGLMDNIAALKWIKENIASFGGDPGSVTIFGESSGAGSVSQLLGVKASWPYFHRAIMESGTAAFWTYMDIDAAYTNFQKVLSRTGCSHAADKVSCLLAAPSNAVSSAVSSVPCRDGCNWAPVVDGIFIKGRTLELARALQLRPNTQIIAGFNLNDGALFVPGYPTAQSSMSKSSLASYYSTRYGIERTATLQSLFPVQQAVAPSWLSKYFYSAQECETDFSYACTAQSLSSMTSSQGSSTYVYQFSEPSSDGMVLHGAEIGYVFGTLAAPSPQQQQVSAIMMGFWANFAKTGDPNAHGLPSWPTWNLSAPLLNISVKSTIAFMPNHSFKGCSFFDANWDYYGGCLPINPSNAERQHVGNEAQFSPKSDLSWLV